LRLIYGLTFNKNIPETRRDIYVFINGHSFMQHSPNMQRNVNTRFLFMSTQNVLKTQNETPCLLECLVYCLCKRWVNTTV